jgi:glycosyltransferase involved in cell wall biosynthesis
MTELHQAIADRELQGIVQIAPHIADMPAAYLLSDIVVSASTDPEAFGRVAAEAAAMGRPVIATDHGGARETVLAKRSGLLVPPANPVALTDALRTLLSMTGEQRRQLGDRGRRHVRAHFSLERMCTDTIGLYRSLLSDSSSV